MTEKFNPEQEPILDDLEAADPEEIENDIENDANGAFAENSGPKSEGKFSDVKDPDWKTQAAYLAAEIVNMQKRFARETGEIRRFASEDVLKKVTPALDNLSLALSAVEKAKNSPENEKLVANKLFAGFVQGVEMTVKQFEQTLSGLGVEFIKSVGEKFDPNLHEALGQTHNPDLKDEVIAEEMQRGFKLNGKIVRHAKVLVNKEEVK